MVMREARTSRFSVRIDTRIIAPVNIVAFLGSFFAVFAEKNPDIGTVFCSARATSILGAPTRLARAEENVAANMPPTTSEGHMALSTIEEAVPALIRDTAGRAGVVQGRGRGRFRAGGAVAASAHRCRFRAGARIRSRCTGRRIVVDCLGFSFRGLGLIGVTRALGERAPAGTSVARKWREAR